LGGPRREGEHRLGRSPRDVMVSVRKAGSAEHALSWAAASRVVRPRRRQPWGNAVPHPHGCDCARGHLRISAGHTRGRVLRPVKRSRAGGGCCRAR